MPENLLALKLQGNPLVTEGANKFTYRRDFILALENLEELDRLKVLPAERLNYQGLLPKVKIMNLLTDLELKTQQDESYLRLEIEIQQERQADLGKSSKEVMIESLEEFG